MKISNSNRLLPFTPQVGDIILTRQKGVGSWALRVLHGPFPYSHACLMGEIVNGRPSIYTAGHTGDNTKPFAFINKGYYRHLDAQRYLADKDFVVCRFKKGGRNLSMAQKNKILDWCKEQLGEKYPSQKVLKYLREGLKGTGIEQIDLPELIESEHCFEGVAKAYQKAGVILNERAGNIDASGYDGKEIYLSPHLYDVYESPKKLALVKIHAWIWNFMLCRTRYQRRVG